MGDPISLSMDLALPGQSSDEARAQQQLEQFKAAWPNLHPALKKGVRDHVLAERHREYDHEARMLLDFLNSKRRSRQPFRPVEANLRLIRARLAEPGVDVNVLRAVIANKARQVARHEFNPKYFRPETLFGATKCHQYIGELGAG